MEMNSPIIWGVIGLIPLSLIYCQPNYDSDYSKITNLDQKSTPEKGYVDSLSPYYVVSNGFTGLLVSDSQKIPQGYVSSDGNDIGPKAEADKWRKYLASQRILNIFCLLLILWFIGIIIFGIIYAFCCSKCRSVHVASPGKRYCLGSLLGLLALAMILILILAILATVQLKKNLQSLPRKGHCHTSNSSTTVNDDGDMMDTISEPLRKLYVRNYQDLPKKVEDSLENKPHSFGEVKALAKTIQNLGQGFKNLPKVQTLLDDFKRDLAKGRRLATQLRDGLRGVKRELMVHLISGCKNSQCQDFYRQNEIRILDLGCLHYDSLPDTEDFLKGIQELSKSTFASYPEEAAKQLLSIASAFKDHLNRLLKVVHEGLEKGAKNLQEKHKASLEVFKKVLQDKKEDSKSTIRKAASSPPFKALRRKLGSSWYATTLIILCFLMVVPLLLLISLLIVFSSPRVATWLLCLATLTIFVLFWLIIIPLLFYLVHGALLYHAFCSGGAGSSKGLTKSHSETDIRKVLRHCVNNDTLYNALGLKDHYNLDGFRSDLLDDINKDLKNLESASIPTDLKPIHPKADDEAQKLLKSNLSGYNSTMFTQHICRQLVPEPKPGPLPEVIRNLESLSGRVDAGPVLQNQAIHLRAFHNNLAEPLLRILEKLLRALKGVDNVLAGGFGSFAKHITQILAKIKQGDEYLNQDMNKFSRNINDVVESKLDDYIRKVDEATHDAEAICEPLTRRDSKAMKDYTDLCNRIVKPIFILPPF
ncbi:prominin-like protein isoform X2 [Drosophila bipectinata]|uniref:prominin-like protein isoform X2 n=1 Tax=Drosophila bipectinata TaxID=42026 RepID=UPI0038B2B90C